MPIYILDVSAVKYNFCVEKIVGKLAFFLTLMRYQNKLLSMVFF